jgi:hypothetical protein
MGFFNKMAHAEKINTNFAFAKDLIELSALFN